MDRIRDRLIEYLVNFNFTTFVIWGVWFMMMGVLLDHTAWGFSIFESPTPSENKPLISWMGAIAIEAVQGAATHKLSIRLGAARRSRDWKKRLSVYIGWDTFVIILAGFISGLANTAHAMEYYREDLRAFMDFNLPPMLYLIAFGTVLPVVSLAFAALLTKATAEDMEQTEEKSRLETNVRDLTKQLRKANRVQEQLGGLLSGKAKERVLTLLNWKPDLEPSAIAKIAECSPTYVSNVKKEWREGRRK
jgi:hypothetical protein